MTATPAPALPSPAPSRGRLVAEVLIVLGLGLGQSAIYAVVQLIDLLSRGPLSGQTQTLNPSISSREYFDLTYQLLGIAFVLMPVVLVCWLLWNPRGRHLERLGIDARRPLRDGWQGILIALVIGAAGLGVYLGGRALGLSVVVQPSGLASYWWTVPVLVLSAFRAGLQEEVVMIGYLYERMRTIGWPSWAIVAGSAVLRGSYHLYQGYSAFIGNALMGAVFGILYLGLPERPGRLGRVLRVLSFMRGRLWPLVIAHSLIDAAVFVGYPLAYPWLHGLGLV